MIFLTIVYNSKYVANLRILFSLYYNNNVSAIHSHLRDGVMRQVCAFSEHPTSRGRVAVLGSGHMLTDHYIDKEENTKIKDVIFQYLTTPEFKLDQIDADDPEVSIPSCIF